MSEQIKGKIIGTAYKLDKWKPAIDSGSEPWPLDSEGNPLTWQGGFGYFSTPVNLCDKAALTKLYEDEGRPTESPSFREWLVGKSEAGIPVPGYQTAQKWCGVESRKQTTTSSSPNTSVGSSKTAISLEQEFEAQYKAERDSKLREFLKDKVSQLATELAAAQGALRNHEERMGIIAPTIEE